MTVEFNSNPLVNLVFMGAAVGWATEHWLSAVADRSFPGDARKSATAELVGIGMLDTIYILYMINTALNGDPQVAGIILPLFGSYIISLSGFGMARCMQYASPSVE